MAEKKEEKPEVVPVVKVEPRIKAEPRRDYAPAPGSPDYKARMAKENEKRKAAGKPLLKERVLFVPE